MRYRRARRPRLRLKVGVWSFVGEATEFKDTAGPLVLIVKIDVALLPTLPALSDCSACAV
jgi:hypothetical protein